jgi:hypothetical protein
MQLSKKIPFDDPNVLNGVRALYVFSNVLILGIYLYVQQQINKKRGMLMRFRRFPSLRTMLHQAQDSVNGGQS